MKLITPITLLLCFLFSCSDKTPPSTIQENKQTNEKPDSARLFEVSSFSGQQVTGVTVTHDARVFANFPRWRSGVKYAVVEVDQNDHSYAPYPNEAMNKWNIGDRTSDSIFVSVQSVVAFENNLYVLDTRNPKFEGVLDAPRVFVFNLRANELQRIYVFNEGSYLDSSYINDLRVDKKKGKIYFTDSGAGGLVVLDIESGITTRVLDNHKSTLAEVKHLTINNKKWKNTIHVDGIALDEENDKLYYHALSGYTLYSIRTDSLIKATDSLSKSVVEVRKTSAPDGMIFDKKGNLYYADLENHKIHYITPKGEIKTLLEGEKYIKWADTFSIHDGFLYYTNSRIHEAQGDISNLDFTIYKVELPKL